MAQDKKDGAPTATPPQPQPGGAGIQIVTQYIKDLSFESPNAPESLVSGWQTPDTTVQVFLGSKPVKENAYECLMQYRVEAKKKGEEKLCFIADLHYGALVVLHNVPAEAHQPALMIEVPKLMFPFVREIIASLTANGGYPPLYLTPVSFEAIYIQELKRQQSEAGKQKSGAAKN